jgi:membrane protein DedA with SNARE-associated domain
MDLFFGWIAQYGYLALKQKLTVFPAMMAAFLGSACGISLSYGFGRTAGIYLVRTLGHLIGVDEDKLEQVRAWYGRRGKHALLFGYFVPGVRHVTAVVAGSAKLPPTVFAVYAYSGGLLWSLSFLAIGYFLGEEWSRLSAPIHRALVAVAGVGLGGLAVWLLLMRTRHKYER